MKKKCCIVVVFLLFACNHKDKVKTDEILTILKKNNTYFEELNWTDSKTISPEGLPEPFNIKDANSNILPFYSDTNIQDSIFPSMEDLGILDYSGIDASLLTFLNTVTEELKTQKIDPIMCVKEKPFLPYLINYRLKSISKITSIYYSRPTSKSNKKMQTKLKCKLNKNYALFELTTMFVENKWLIDSLDLIEVKNE